VYFVHNIKNTRFGLFEEQLKDINLIIGDELNERWQKSLNLQ
jgi:hypothetical protein